MSCSDFQTLAMAFRIMRLKKQARWSSRLQEIFQVINLGNLTLTKLGSGSGPDYHDFYPKDR